MSEPTLPPALGAFLRGIEPRARVLARAQAGPALDAEALLREVRGRFAERAPRLPVAEWPLRYWGLLLARDELARPGGATPAHPLYRLAHTRRLALLLRLVVGLEPAGAARVLGVSETAYRALWADAEDKLAEMDVGPDVLLRWQSGFQQEVRADGAGDDARRAAEPAASAGMRAPRDRPRPRWRPTGLQIGLALAAIALLAVLAATFVWPPAGASSEGPAGPADDLVAAPLAAPAAASRRDLDADLVVDPDFSVVAAAADAPWRQGVAFLSWWLLERGMSLPAPGPPPASAPEWSALPSPVQALLAPVRSAWPALDAETRRALRAQAEAWLGADGARRAALREAYRAWLALPALERAGARAAYAEWRALDASEQQALAAAAQAFAALPVETQQAERAAFAALPPQRQRDWALGPRLGRELPGLRPLLAFVPAADQAALSAAIEGLGADTRAALAERIAAMGTAERAALRARVLAAPSDRRAALLAEAAAPR